ncbi:MAG: hypothetical protein J0H68_09445 [Sphingobacteriia bacterium]|nr:hypothetical protein [Sphingobacteriia bacterium]
MTLKLEKADFLQLVLILNELREINKTSISDKYKMISEIDFILKKYNSNLYDLKGLLEREIKLRSKCNNVN